MADSVLEGIAASAGIAAGRALVFSRVDLTYDPGSAESPDREIERLREAIGAAVEELVALKEQVMRDMGEESAHIIRSQQTILEDESTADEMFGQISEDRCRAEAAVEDVFGTYMKLFEELGEDDYNRERIADIVDVQKRLLRILLKVREVSLADIDTPTIVVAEELFPSDTVLMNRDYVRGIVTERGGITSHAAILAGNLGIPASVGTTGAMERIADGTDLYLDVSGADTAYTFIEPDPTTCMGLDNRRNLYEERRKKLAEEKDLEPVTRDGHTVTLSANIGSVEEIGSVLEAGGKSVGLFRSEFIFIHHKGIPDEETQFQAYRKAVEAFSDGFVVLRTLDVGGDKPVESISIPSEENPFLGYRGVRISLDRSDLFEVQIRAALRASAFGTMKIMFPMVSGPGEVRRILKTVDREKEKLTRAGTDFDPDLEIGIMIEVPSAVFMAPELAKMVDFFSIGTNDLTQYLLAADRMNEQVRDYYQPYNPAVFRAIDALVRSAHAEGAWVGVCGELGGMTPAIPALVGLGVDELSMNSRSLAEAIYLIRRMEYANVQKLAQRVLQMEDQTALKAVLSEFIAKEE